MTDKMEFKLRLSLLLLKQRLRFLNETNKDYFDERRCDPEYFEAKELLLDEIWIQEERIKIQEEELNYLINIELILS